MKHVFEAELNFIFFMVIMVDMVYYGKLFALLMMFKDRIKDNLPFIEKR